MAAAGRAGAVDPQPYTVAIAGTGKAALDKALRAASELRSLREKAPVAPFALVVRAREDVGHFAAVLQSLGYYQGRVAIAIAGRGLDDPGLVEALSAVPAPKPVEVRIAVDPGPLFHLRHIRIEGAVPPGAAKLGLVAGRPAIAADVIAAAARLLAALQEAGYPLARVEPPEAVEDAPGHAIDVTFKAEAGRRAVIGAIRLSGLKAVGESIVRRRLRLRPGQLYQPSKIEAARRDLAALGVFAGVSVHAAPAIAPDGTIPLTYEFQERPQHAFGVTAAFSTDLGGSLATTWSHRNLFGNAEQLNLSAAATGLGGTAVQGLGYNLSAQFLRPDFVQRDQTFEADLAALKQSLQAYDQQAVTAGAALRRKLSAEWSLSFGVSAETETIEQERVTRDYTLFSLPVTAKYDSTGLTNLLEDPIYGIRAAVTATPTLSLGGKSSLFATLQAAGSTYFDLGHLWFGTTGRSVLALRGLVGSLEGGAQFALPPDQRFYGGGSSTVRGFRYQSIGPLFLDRNPEGGTAIDAGSIEFRQRLFGDFGVAGFVDAGQVSARNLPFVGALRVGVGIGLRYYTPIGPVRLDVALPVNRPPGGDRFEFYIGLGQAF